MGRAPCCAKVGLHRGPWTAKEDMLLTKFIEAHGEGQWSALPKKAGLLRCGKSCRFRWVNYLRSDIKRGNITTHEEELIVRMHKLLGNRWSLIAGRLPGRTDNDIKNYWNTHICKKIKRKHESADLPKPSKYIAFSPPSSHISSSSIAIGTSNDLEVPQPNLPGPVTHLKSPRSISINNKEDQNLFPCPFNDEADDDAKCVGVSGNNIVPSSYPQVYEEYMELLRKDSNPDNNIPDLINVLSDCFSSVWDCLQEDEELLNQERANEQDPLLLHQ